MAIDDDEATYRAALDQAIGQHYQRREEIQLNRLRVELCGATKGTVKHEPFGPDLWEPYAAALEQLGSTLKAADCLNVSRRVVWAAREKHPEFDQLCQDALERYRFAFVNEARRRAIDGVPEPIIGGKNRDEIVAEVQKYSDRLLECFLKRAPGENGSFVQSGTTAVQTTNINIAAHFDVTVLSPEARRLLRRLLEQIKYDQDLKALTSGDDDDTSSAP